MSFARACVGALLVLVLWAPAILWQPTVHAGPALELANAGDDAGHRAPQSPDAGPISYFGFSPLVIRLAGTTNPYFYIQTDNTITSAYITLTNGSTLSLIASGSGYFHNTLTHAQAVYGYTAADYNHNFVGYLNVFQGATKAAQYNLFINILDSQIPSVVPHIVSVQAQQTPHVVNLYLPGLYPATMDDQVVATAFYQDFADNYDFLNIIYTPQHFANRYHFATRNTVSGIGLGLFDNDALYGVPAAHRLRGISVYPIVSYFDMAERTSLHELGHQWINFLTVPKLQGVTPHWPVSSLAYGMMGWQCCGNPQGLEWPYKLTPLIGGDYQCNYAGSSLTYNNMELYLMGLVPSSEAGSYVVFTDQNQNCGTILNGPVQTVTSADVIAQHGARSPAWPSTQSKFRVATIVVSQSFLSADEMAFLDYFAARGSLTIPVGYTSGFSSGTAWPFYLATGGRGCLVTTIDFTGGCYRLELPLIRR